MLGPPRLRQLALLALVVLAGCGASEPSGSTGVVERVTDGDTVRLVGVGRVRLIGVDTPEVYGQSECFGREASAFVRRLLPPGASVRYRVGVEPRDRYGRLLAYIWLDDGHFLNLALAERGYALPLTIPPNVDHAAEFVAAAREARSARRGLWAACQLSARR